MLSCTVADAEEEAQVRRGTAPHCLACLAFALHWGQPNEQGLCGVSQQGRLLCLGTGPLLISCGFHSDTWAGGGSPTARWCHCCSDAASSAQHLPVGFKLPLFVLQKHSCDSTLPASDLE